MKTKANKHNISVLHQIVKLIPHGILVGGLSLNDTCDALGHHSVELIAMGCYPPTRNNFSHANKVRSAAMVEELFWVLLEHFVDLYPKFAKKDKYLKVPHRFKNRKIYACDSSTIKLIASCLGWAKHRAQKAAAKMHCTLNLKTFLPEIVIVEEASHHDSFRAPELCSAIGAGCIVLFDKAYINFSFLHSLHKRDINWVTRAKDNMVYTIVNDRPIKEGSNIISDMLIRVCPKKRDEYPALMRLVTADVEVNKKIKRMTFLTNNTDWAPSSICDLYDARWGIETFFKELKQSLQLCDFLGHTKNAIQWQIWSGLVTYLLVRVSKYLTNWKRGYKHYYTLLRGILWKKLLLYDVVSMYGIAPKPIRTCAFPQYLYLPGLAPPNT